MNFGNRAAFVQGTAARNDASGSLLAIDFAGASAENVAMNRKLLFALFVVIAAAAEARAADPIVPPAVIGHRGLVHSAPENTLAAFRACLALRFGFEFDVRRTKDGQLVCLHDAALERTTSGKGRLSDLTLAEVRRLDAGAWFAPSFTEERVPLIDEILELAARAPPNSGLLAVDLKEAGEAIEAALVKSAAQRRVQGRLIFIGLTIESAEVRSRLKAADRAAPTARLAKDEAAIADVLADPDADWVYVRFLPTPAAVARIHGAGKRLFLAGPLVAGNEPGNWKQATDLGVDAILTDYPLELARQLR
jgi:glycerophosphoryl diester phosphodiesterase